MRGAAAQAEAVPLLFPSLALTEKRLTCVSVDAPAHTCMLCAYLQLPSATSRGGVHTLVCLWEDGTGEEV